MSIPGLSRRLIVLSFMIGSLVVAGCGSSRMTLTGGTSTGADSTDPALLAVSRCMRTHGVPNFPDPAQSAQGEGLSVAQTPGSSVITVGGIAFSGPAFTSATKICHFGPGGGASREVSESAKRAAETFARCMRQHGITSYPDPVFPSGGGIKVTEPPASPAVNRAETACNMDASRNSS